MTTQRAKIRGGWNSLLQKLEVIEEILCVARRRTRSIVSLCEELDDRRKVQNLPIRTIFMIQAEQIKEIVRRLDTLGRCL